MVESDSSSKQPTPQFKRVVVPQNAPAPRRRVFLLLITALGGVGGAVIGLSTIPRAFRAADQAPPEWLPLATIAVGLLIGFIVAMVSVHIALRRRSG